jgi:uncharacterized protein (TIGR03435 family)
MSYVPATLLFLAMAFWLRPQGGDAGLNFEVASVKAVSQDSAGASSGTISKRGASALSGAPSDLNLQSWRNATLSRLLKIAYGLPQEEIIGPEWLDSELYDIEAKMPAGATEEQVPTMLRNLIIDRFQMRAHHEKRVLPMFQMVIAKSGPKLKPYVERSAPLPELKVSMALPRRRDGSTGIHAQGSLEVLALRLTSVVGRPVVNRTGLSGSYEFNLSWQVASTQTAGPAGVDALPASDPSSDIFSALQSQLGLTLRSAEGPVDVLVLDHVERVPTSN